MSLINDAKLKCYITSEESAEINRLQRIVDDAEIKIARLIGVDDGFDFEDPSTARELLLNYIWYAWNDSENEFKTNYIDDIMAERRLHEVERYAEKEANNS